MQENPGNNEKKKKVHSNTREMETTQEACSSSQDATEENNETEEKLPMLIKGLGFSIVLPHEATHDVLAGRVPFLYVHDKEGATVFRPQHVFSALKLDGEKREKMADYSCLGGHERTLERRPRRREGLGYRRRYLDPELMNRGIYGSEGGRTFLGRRMSSGPSPRGYPGPRA